MVYFISLTTDNASVNDVAVATVSDLLLTRYGIPKTSDMHIRCFAHVVNLVVQAFLYALDEAESPDQEDHYLLGREYPIHYDVMEDDELQVMELEEPNVNQDDKDDFDKVDDITVSLYEGQSALKRVCHQAGPWCCPNT
jgi:hypothetical protein